MTVTPLANGFCFGEGPRWFEGMLWFSDMLGEAVHTVDHVRDRPPWRCPGMRLRASASALMARCSSCRPKPANCCPTTAIP